MSVTADAAAGQGSDAAAQGAEGTKDEAFDEARAKATIAAQRASEDKAKAEAKDAREAAAAAKAELDTIKAQLAKDEETRKKAEDEKLTEAERTKKRMEELEAKVAQTESAGQARVAKAALKAAAAAANAHYPGDIPALIDPDKVKFDRSGEPTNADELVAELVKDRPALFKDRKPGSGDGGPRGGSAGGTKPSMDDLLRSAAKGS